MYNISNGRAWPTFLHKSFPIATSMNMYLLPCCIVTYRQVYYIYRSGGSFTYVQVHELYLVNKSADIISPWSGGSCSENNNHTTVYHSRHCHGFRAIIIRCGVFFYFFNTTLVYSVLADNLSLLKFIRVTNHKF